MFFCIFKCLVVPGGAIFDSFLGNDAVVLDKVETSILQTFMMFCLARFLGSTVAWRIEKGRKTTSENLPVFVMENKGPRQFLYVFTIFLNYSLDIFFENLLPLFLGNLFTTEVLLGND